MKLILKTIKVIFKKELMRSSKALIVYLLSSKNKHSKKSLTFVPWIIGNSVRKVNFILSDSTKE